MSNRQQPFTHSRGSIGGSMPPICDRMVTSIPRCLCGANVGNCVREKCHQSLGKNPNARIRLEEWRQACILASEHCQSDVSRREACSVGYDYNLIKQHNRQKKR